jgi:hypothetical protein
MLSYIPVNISLSYCLYFTVLLTLLRYVRLSANSSASSLAEPLPLQAQVAILSYRVEQYCTIHRENTVPYISAEMMKCSSYQRPKMSR